MAIHITIIGPNVNSQKNNEDGKSGDNGPLQKDHSASVVLSAGGGAPSGSQVAVADWTEIDFGSLSFDHNQWSNAREIIIWGDKPTDAISQIKVRTTVDGKTSYCLKDLHGIGDNNKLRSITFYVPVYKIGDKLFKDWTRNETLNIVFVGGFGVIGDQAFYNCDNSLAISVIESSIDEEQEMAIGMKPDYYDETPSKFWSWVGHGLAAAAESLVVIVATVVAVGIGAIVGGTIGFTIDATAGFTTLGVSTVAGAIAGTVAVLPYAAAQLGHIWTETSAGMKKSYFVFEADDGHNYNYYTIDKKIQIGNSHHWWRDGQVKVKLGTESFYNCRNQSMKELLFGDGYYREGGKNEALLSYVSQAYIVQTGNPYSNSWRADTFWEGFGEIFMWYGREWEWAASQYNSIAPTLTTEQQQATLNLLNWNPTSQSYKGIIMSLVGEIGQEAFVQEHDLDFRFVPEKIILCGNVGTRAFAGDDHIHSVEFRSGTELTIGDEAFIHCTKLSYISLNGHVRVIGNLAFYNTNIITSDLIADYNNVFTGKIQRFEDLQGYYNNYAILIQNAIEQDNLECENADDQILMELDDIKEMYEENIDTAMKLGGFTKFLRIPIVQHMLDHWRQPLPTEDEQESEKDTDVQEKISRLDFVTKWLDGGETLLYNYRQNYIVSEYLSYFNQEVDILTTERANELYEEGDLRWYAFPAFQWFVKYAIENQKITQDGVIILKKLWISPDSNIGSIFAAAREAYVMNELRITAEVVAVLEQSNYSNLYDWIATYFLRMNSDYYYNFLYAKPYVDIYWEKAKSTPGITEIDAIIQSLYELQQHNTKMTNHLDEYSSESIFRQPITQPMLDMLGVEEIGIQAFAMPSSRSAGNITQIKFVDDDNKGTINKISQNAFAYNKITSLNFPTTLGYLGGGAFKDNKQLTAVYFMSYVNPFIHEDDEDNDGTLWNDWTDNPPFLGCYTLTKMGLDANNLNAVYSYKKGTRDDEYSYIHTTYINTNTPGGREQQLETNIYDITIVDNTIYHKITWEDTVLPSPVSVLRLNVGLGFGKSFFAESGVTKVYFKDWSVWCDTWNYTGTIRTITQLPFNTRAEWIGEYYVEENPIFEWQDEDNIIIPYTYDVNAALASANSLSNYEPSMFYKAKPFTTLRFTRFAANGPRLTYNTPDDIHMKWQCKNLEIDGLGTVWPITSDTKYYPPMFIDDDNEIKLDKYFATDRFAAVYFDSLVLLQDSNQMLTRTLLSGAVNHFRRGAEFEKVNKDIYLYLPSSIESIQDGALGSELDLIIREPDKEWHEFAQLVYINDVTFYENITNTITIDTTDTRVTNDNYQALLNTLAKKRDTSENHAEAKERIAEQLDNQAVLKFYKNGLYNILLHWKLATTAASSVIPQLLSPNLSVVAKGALDLSVLSDLQEEKILLFDFAFLGASVAAQKKNNEFSYLKYIFGEDTKNIYIRHPKLKIDFIYTQVYELLTFPNTNNDSRPLGGIPHFNTFVFRDPTPEYIGLHDWHSPTLKISGPFLEDNAIVDNIILHTRKMPLSLFAYDTGITTVNVLDCKDVWSMEDQDRGAGVLETKAFCNITKIKHFICPKNLVSIETGCWHNDVVIDNFYYHAPLRFWGFEVNIPTALENPMRHIVNFYTNENDTIFLIDDNDPTNNGIRGYINEGFEDNIIDWNVSVDNLLARNPIIDYQQSATMSYLCNYNLLDYSLMRLPSTSEQVFAIRNYAYYYNWFINSICLDYITQVGVRSLDNMWALRELYSETNNIYTLYSHGLSKSYFSHLINTKITNTSEKETIISGGNTNAAT